MPHSTHVTQSTISKSALMYFTGTTYSTSTTTPRTIFKRSDPNLTPPTQITTIANTYNSDITLSPTYNPQHSNQQRLSTRGLPHRVPSIRRLSSALRQQHIFHNIPSLILILRISITWQFQSTLSLIPSPLTLVLSAVVSLFSIMLHLQTYVYLMNSSARRE